LDRFRGGGSWICWIRGGKGRGGYIACSGVASVTAMFGGRYV
jgi:hypothetical protein